MKTEIGTLQINYAHGIRSYCIEISHEGLKKHRRIRSPILTDVQNKARLQAKEWDAKWEKMKNAWDLEEIALIRSADAKKELARLKSLLRQALEAHIDPIEKLRDNSSFPESKPEPSPPRPKPILKEIPKEPIETKIQFQPDVSASLICLIPWLKRKVIADHTQKVAANSAKFKEELAAWQKAKMAIEAENIKQQREYDCHVKKITTDYQNRVKEWSIRRKNYISKKNADNDRLVSLKGNYLNLNSEAVNNFFSIVLEFSEYPEYFAKEFRIEYLPEIKTLLIDYSLPKPESIPTLKEVRYVKARDELIERHITQSEYVKLYDDVLYQIVLRTIYEVLKVDEAVALEAVIFNGWVRTIDRSTGKEVNPCVMSLHCKRSEFMALDLSNIDPKLCFKFLKGVGSSKLYNLAGIAPILQVQKDDKRFISGYEVVNALDESYNLATMDWDDFEHLIRELFEKEFSREGCEVKVTRASRDGGVDAIIFDPDPIHGGKIVVQAKRYTNPVGVSAIRDLYGTVLNEGANKGILVTTSDYGPDSYSFANGKPLTLLNGGNLLHLLEKHGHKVKIDLQEAKR